MNRLQVALVAKPARSDNDRVHSAMAAVFMAARLCGLTDREASALVGATMVVGMMSAAQPDRRAELVAETQRRTTNLVVAARLRNDRRAA